MDTLYDLNAHAAEHLDESETQKGNCRDGNRKIHTSTFDLIPVLTSKRMRSSIKEQIKKQLDKISE